METGLGITKKRLCGLPEGPFSEAKKDARIIRVNMHLTSERSAADSRTITVNKLDSFFAHAVEDTDQTRSRCYRSQRPMTGRDSHPQESTRLSRHTIFIGSTCCHQCAPMAEIRSCGSLTLIVGVLPRGAQKRLNVGAIMKPVSSMKTMYEQAFFGIGCRT